MALENLSANSQDYLKVIWDLQEWTGEAVQPTALAKKTGMKLSTVSGAIGRLAAAGLVEHTPYGAITLTQKGEEYALVMVRRHRLLETFLASTLGYGWDEVHQEADSLEHAVSDELIDRIDERLGHPTRDPHGDPIPDADGRIKEEPDVPLQKVPEGAEVTVRRVSDEDPDLLRYLTSEGIAVGSKLLIGHKAPYSNSITVSVVPDEHTPNSDIDESLQAASEARTRISRGSKGSQHEAINLGIATAEYIRVEVNK